MSNRTAVVGAALVAMTLLAIGPARAGIEPAPGEARIAYVASVDPTYTGCCSTPALGVQPDGAFLVTPVGRSFTLNIDDFGTQAGSVWVRVAGNGIDFDGCIPVRTTRTFTAQSQGQSVLVILQAKTALVGVRPCPATAGVVTVTGVA